MTTQIKNQKHIAILGVPFTVDTMGGKHTYAKGYRANVLGMLERGGEYIVEGHGIGHIIPRANFTKFLRTWDEVTVNTVGGVQHITKEHKVEDDTAATLAWFNEQEAKANKKANVWKRGVVRTQIANLRKAIADVKAGRAEKKLAELLAELETLK